MDCAHRNIVVVRPRQTFALVRTQPKRPRSPGFATRLSLYSASMAARGARPSQDTKLVCRSAQWTEGASRGRKRRATVRNEVAFA